MPRLTAVNIVMLSLATHHPYYRFPQQPELLLLLLYSHTILAFYFPLHQQRRQHAVVAKTQYHPNLFAFHDNTNDLSSSSSYDVVIAATPNNNDTTTTYNGTLGDIMSSSPVLLITDHGESLAQKYGITFAMDRILVTANGNLQRILSSWYDAPVHVVVDHCTLDSSTGTWDRLVHLQVQITTARRTTTSISCCQAHATITIHDDTCQELVQTGQVGLGQLFRYLDRLPTFLLVDAGYNPDGGLWRLYQLNCKELSCTIREDFIPNLWNIK